MRTKVSVASWTPSAMVTALGPGVVEQDPTACSSECKASGSASPPEPRPEASPFCVRERHPEYAIVQGALDSAMLERLTKFLNKKRPQPAKMKNEGGNSDDERKARYDDRDSRVSWFNARAECMWLHQRMAEIVRYVANVEWPMLRVDTAGKVQCDYEETQYAVYGPNQHFKAWHQDAYEDGHDPEDARQITIVLMISERTAYTGGQLQARLKGADGRKLARSLRLEAGDAAVFPAKRLVHRVTAVKSGTRKTLVFWANDKASCKYHQNLMQKGAQPGPPAAAAPLPAS